MITPDGYMLMMHRIPHGRNEIVSSKRPPVFLQHGLACSSADYLIAGTNEGLGYILADAGYDVWMGNFRGNTYSRKHIRLQPHQRKFWRFSWHEMGAIDLPAMIDYVLNKTGEESLHYIGHSQGTTTFFVMGAVAPEYNKKIRGAHLLAPAAYMSSMTSPLIRTFSPLVNIAEVFFNVFGSGELLANGDILSLAGEGTCKANSVITEICSNLVFLFVGFNSDQLNRTLLPEIMKRTPAGLSTRQMLHYIQAVRNGKFQQYDNGMFGNMIAYGSENPPEYDLKKVTAPVYLYSAMNDWLVSQKDVKKLRKNLPNIQFDYVMPYKNWNHIDFIWGMGVKEMLYDIVIANIKKSDKVLGIK